VIAAGRLEDDDPQVRLAALLTLAECPADPSVALALVQTLFRQDGPPDPVLVDGLIAAAARNSGEFLASLSRSRLERAPRPAEIGVAARVAEHHARGKLPVDQILTSAAIGGPRLAGPVLAGLEKGWPEGATIPLSPEARAALVTLIGRLEGDSLAAFVGLARRWGAEGLDDAFAKVLTSLEAELDNDAAGEAGRIAAARRLIQLAAPGSDATATILRHITPRTPPGVASGWVEALGTSSSPTVADSMIEALPALLPDARSSALRTLLSRPAWTKSLLDAIESGSVRLDALALDQRQALATHRDRTIAERAKSLLAKGGGLPDANRQSVIEQLSDQLAKGGDPTKGKLAFETHCAKCHRHTGEGGDVGPDLSGMAAHPREELMVHLLDPSRSVEGTFVLYTVAMSDGRVLSGMLASESRTSIELIDTEGKKQTILRDDIDELVATSKSVMPEGFEKQMAVDDLRNLLAFLTQRGKYLPLDIAKVATAVSTKGMFYDENSPAERIVFPDWAPKTLDNIPFVLVDPKGDRVRNAVVLQSRSGPLTRNHPRNVELPCHTSAKAIHLLGGIGGWAYPYNSEKTVSLIVRLHYADGQVEDHSLRNGEHIADYNKVVDVPGSKLAMKLRNDYQIRSITITPKREAEIDHIELVKGQDATAPIVMAVTVETK
jgi:putative heme-binding domain-containing protein